MTKRTGIIIGILIVFLMAAFAGNILAGQAMTIVGVVNDDGQIVDDSGVIYEIAENSNSEAVAEKTGNKVEVTGMVEEDSGGNKMLTIESFKVIE
jgi:predicted transcriptional regulator